MGNDPMVRVSVAPVVSGGKDMYIFTYVLYKARLPDFRSGVFSIVILP